MFGSIQLSVWAVTLVILTIMHFILTLRAINVRKECKDFYHLPKSQEQIAIIRAHANFSEFVPLSLILLLGLALLKSAIFPLTLFSILLILSRVLHATSLCHFEQAETPSFKYRRYGMALNLFVNTASAIYLLELLIKSHL